MMMSAAETRHLQVTPTKQQHVSIDDDGLLSQWSQKSDSFLEQEEEFPSRTRIQPKSSLGSGHRRISERNSNSSSVGSRIFIQSRNLFQSGSSSITQISPIRKKKLESKRRTKAKILLTIVLISVFLCSNRQEGDTYSMTTVSLDGITTGGSSSSEAKRRKPPPPPPPTLYPKSPRCTTDQLMKIRHHLPPEPCVHQHMIRQPYMQLCSLTAATKCPNATWLEDYYLDLQREHYDHQSSSSNSKPLLPSDFLGFSIGCNKGFDAINTLRMGIYDSGIDKVKWKQAMTGDGSSELHQSVCSQDSAVDMFPILDAYNNSTPSTLRPRGEMHCIEPMPQTYRKLKQSAETLGYTDKGFVVTHGAVSKASGEIPFLSGGLKAGVENIGLGSGEGCKEGSKYTTNPQESCEMVKVYSLLELVENKVQAPESQNINVLSIDVEGFDADVLLGATSKVLERVEYLEFEYNWMGSWKGQHLYDIIQLLDEQANMVCYWAGRDRLWRITECWMSYYDIHSWSNVACANRGLVPDLAAKMEETFQRTLQDDDDTQWVKKPKHLRKLSFWRMQYKDHLLLSLDEDKLRQKHIRP